MNDDLLYAYCEHTDQCPHCHSEQITIQDYERGNTRDERIDCDTCGKSFVLEYRLTSVYEIKGG